MAKKTKLQEICEKENIKRPHPIPIDIDKLLSGMPSYHRVIFQLLLDRVDKLEQTINNK